MGSLDIMVRGELGEPINHDSHQLWLVYEGVVKVGTIGYNSIFFYKPLILSRAISKYQHENNFLSTPIEIGSQATWYGST